MTKVNGKERVGIWGIFIKSSNSIRIKHVPKYWIKVRFMSTVSIWGYVSRINGIFIPIFPIWKLFTTFTWLMIRQQIYKSWGLLTETSTHGTLWCHPSSLASSHVPWNWWTQGPLQSSSKSECRYSSFTSICMSLASIFTITMFPCSVVSKGFQMYVHNPHIEMEW